MTRRFTVYTENDKKVLEVTDQPGPLVSVSAPPPRPGQAPTTHPFLSASAYDPFTEGALRNKEVNSDTLAAAKAALTAEITPIDDLRSTKDYRLRVSLNLLEDFVLRLAPTQNLP